MVAILENSRSLREPERRFANLTPVGKRVQVRIWEFVVQKVL